RIPLEESYASVEAENWDFFHINSVDLDGDGNLLVSGRSTHTVYKLDRKGAILWRLGGKHSDFEMAPGSNFAWQHDARRQPDGTLTIFDNGATPAVEKLSRGLILDVDEQAMTATLLRQYTHAKILTGSQGNMQLLEGGNVFIGWGEVPRVSEFERSGRLVFDAVLGEKYQCYRAFRMPWSAVPAEAPAIAVSHDGRTGMTAYASWNGATGVRAWQLLAGPQAGELTPVSNTTARGFESALHSSAAGPYFAVQALDASGAALGQSQTVSIT
ncbi:MAG: arylsulfotransferase family protein, partial [Solirubrobacteraceae bacterium]